MLVCPVCESTFPAGAEQWCPVDGSLLYALGDERAKKRIGPGDVLAGKYELIEEMPRRGGAGRTFRARQTNLDRVVELRLLPNDTITKPTDHARFQREVATWGRLRSDHLVRLYDSGFTEDNAPYMALEWVEGGSLGRRLREAGPLDLDTCRTVARHALLALQAAHEANVLHRDISPDALVMAVRADGSSYCRLTGFGLAKHMGDDEDDPTAITMTGQVIGNPAYMAPETILRGVLDPRTDLYALGVTLYELAAGRRPYPGTSLADMLAAHVKGTADPLKQHRPDVDDRFRGLIEKLMAKDPEARFQSATEALAAMDSGLSHWPEPPRATDAQPLPTLPHDQATVRIALILAGLLLAGGAMLTWLLLR